MRAKLPPVLGVDVKSRLGLVRQITVQPTTIDCSAVKYTLGKSVGHVLRDAAGANLLYLFDARPKTTPLPSDAPVLFAKGASVDQEEPDLTEGTWVTHPAMLALPAAALAAAARRSWHRAFHFAEEEPRSGVVGLRKPQVGALHAIHAHWSTSGESATVVMPTGTGKTETMLAVLTSCSCERVLVVVPTDALRSQIADKFETLGLLKVPSNAVLAEQALRPVVGTLTSKPKSIEEVDSVFLNCNVVVTTILGEKIRYHRDKVFNARLQPAPAVPRMDMDLRQARVQQRWRYADDELAPGEGLNLEALAHDVALLPDAFEGPPDKTADVLLDFFGPGQPGMGGAIEPAADDDGVLIGRSEAATHEPAQAGAS